MSEPKELKRKMLAAESLAEGFQFEDSDLTLVSSDGVSFNIHRYHLEATSSVFRSMFKSCDDNACITLTDDDLESALTLKLVLTFVCYGKFDVAWVNTQRSILVCRFLSKYDIQITLQHLQNLLWGVVARREDCCINTFILGATMGDAKLCAMTIRRKGGLCWHKVNDALDCTKNAGGGPANDLGCLSWDNFSSIPLAYTHAFLRACFMNESETGQKKWEGIADDFERLISKHPGIVN